MKSGKQRSWRRKFITLVVLAVGSHGLFAQPAVTIVNVDSGWAANSVNAVVFRKNALVTHRDYQYISFYDPQGRVVVGKRISGAKHWQLQRTGFTGNVSDAHNTISMMVDGEGYIHLSWDHHNNPLNYAKSLEPGKLAFTGKLPMTGVAESRVSYPEFYRLKNGNLLFFYRNGASGQGNLVMNAYHAKTGRWTQLQRNLIDGEEQRNAYWQACIDQQGTIHLSWVWRETPDVASNHDLCYARSRDGGITWERSSGQQYRLPITAATAEYACRIPPMSELINQTSMTADVDGHPYIATYWRENSSAIPQYQLIYHNGRQWKKQSGGFRNTPFTLRGGGTKRIPVSRPQVIAWQSGTKKAAVLIFRDEERGNRVSVAVNKNLKKTKWRVSDLTGYAAGSWEPSYDTELWAVKGLLNLFVQYVEQVDAEGTADLPAQMVQVLEWNPKRAFKR